MKQYGLSVTCISAKFASASQIEPRLMSMPTVSHPNSRKSRKLQPLRAQLQHPARRVVQAMLEEKADYVLLRKLEAVNVFKSLHQLYFFRRQTAFCTTWRLIAAISGFFSRNASTSAKVKSIRGAKWPQIRRMTSRSSAS